MIGPTVNWDLARSEFTEILAEFRNSEEAPEDFPAYVEFDSILVGVTGDYDDAIEKAEKYAKRLNLDLASSPHGHVFVNGKHFNLDDVRNPIRFAVQNSFSLAGLPEKHAD